MAAINSKQKGKAGELEARKKLRELGFSGAHRNAQQYVGGGSGNADVVGLDGIHLEIKRKERFGIHELYEAMNQSCRDAGPGEIPVVMFRPNRKRWVVIQHVETWAELLRKAQAYDALVSESTK